MNAFNHVLCAPSSKDFLIKIESGMQVGCHLSGPWDLFGFKVFSFFNTRSGVIAIFDKISPLNSSVGSRISIFSTVNMMLKGSVSAFALSHGDTALSH